MTRGAMQEPVIVVRGGAPGDPLAAQLRAGLGADESDRALAGADAALALDAAALAEARAAGVGVRVAVTRGLAARFSGGFEDATHVAIPHAAAGVSAGHRASLVVGLLSAEAAGAIGDANRAGRAAARSAAGLAADARIVVVDAAELRDAGLRGVLIQLALAEPPPAVFFDVGEDVALADALRDELPGHALDAFLFAGADRAAQLPLADLALGRASGAHLERAVVAGLPVLPLPAGDGADELALGVLAASGGLRPPRTLVVLSVALDAALTAATPPVCELDASGAVERLFRATREAVTALRAGRGPRAIGLPVGLERVASRDDVSPPVPVPGDADARLDAELAALKRRL
jgi:hypothetical protein